MTFETARNRGARIAATAILGCTLAAAAVAPAPALAEDGTTRTETGSASSAAFLMADSSKIVASVPTRIDFAVNGDGTLIGPSAEALKIKNESVFGIRVAKLKAEASNGFTFVADASKTGTDNAVELNIAPAGGTVVKASEITSALGNSDPAWSLDRGGSVNVEMGGAVANVTNDLSASQQFATINWTFAPGKIS